MTDRVEEGSTEARRTSGAPYPAAAPEEHDDTQDRPTRSVPSAPGSTGPDDEEANDAD
jgi:hypothetical protein